MKKKPAILLSIIMMIALVCMSFGMSACASSLSISYIFTGSHSRDKGFAEGIITVTADAAGSGTYQLYWADSVAALDGFDPIASVNVTANGSGVYSMPKYTAIPARATCVAAFKGAAAPSDMRISKAAAVYNLPSNKMLGKGEDDLLYSFAAYSDFHMASDSDPIGSPKYPHDEEHLAAAFNSAAARDVDFIVTTGDHVNNQRNDSNGSNNDFYAEEWNRYLKILAQSDFCNPVYEAIGNHELWNYESEYDTTGYNWKIGSDYFVQATGLDCAEETVKSGNSYYEVTEPVTGDHFLFMGLEGGFYTDSNDEFSTAQLDWLESKLEAYKDDDKNVFIMEHANFDKWGSGDQLNNPIYDLPLKDSNAGTTRLKGILKKYKNAVMITGHTHFRLSLQLNYSDNNGTSATMIHNSSVGGVRDIKNGTTRVNDTSLELTEGYFVEVYDDATIFYGANLYYNKIMPSCSYIIPQTTSAVDPQEFIWGDVDGDGEVAILDATDIQRELAGLKYLSNNAKNRGMVTGTGELSILDATAIQRWLAGLIERFDVELMSTGSGDLAEVGAQEDIEASGTELSELRRQVENDLDHYWIMASYDKYMALKKAYKERDHYDSLLKAYNDFKAEAELFYPGDTIDVYFRNTEGWSTVKAYIYNNENDMLTAWPGVTCTRVNSNTWKINVLTGRYNYIIFNNGAASPTQTIDLPLGITKGQGFYTDGQYGSKLLGKEFKYEQ